MLWPSGATWMSSADGCVHDAARRACLRYGFIRNISGRAYLAVFSLFRDTGNGARVVASAGTQRMQATGKRVNTTCI